MSDDEAYRLYLERFARAVGDVEVGGYGKSAGQLVKKLSAPEFARMWQDFVELRATYENVLARGYTLDNAIIRELRERAAQLFVEMPAPLS